MCLGGLRCHLAVAQTNGAQNGSLVSGAKDYHLRFALVLSFCATAHSGLSFVELVPFFSFEKEAARRTPHFFGTGVGTNFLWSFFWRPRPPGSSGERKKTQISPLRTPTGPAS